ncbi:MAG: RidA family protein [Luteibaculum sp.]
MAKNPFNSSKGPKPVGPYSHGAWAGTTFYLSGQIALDKAGNMLQENIALETKQVMLNIKSLLEDAGLSMDHIVKCSIFLSDMGLFAEVNEVYKSYFPENPPARECVAVKGLPKNANVEISVIAAK